MATVLPGTVHARVDQQGRVLIPAELRREMELKCGDRVTLRVEDGVLQVVSVAVGIRRMQEHARKVTGGRKGMVDEFLAERRRESGD